MSCVDKKDVCAKALRCNGFQTFSKLSARGGRGMAPPPPLAFSPSFQPNDLLVQQHKPWLCHHISMVVAEKPVFEPALLPHLL